MIDYLGKVFSKCNGSTYIVTGDKGKYKNTRVRELVVSCSSCSKDKELWPEGSISGLFKQVSGYNTFVCGCSRNVHWTEEQQRIRVKRECIKRGYRFKGFSEDFKGSLTRLTLYNPQIGRTWHTTNIHNFLQGKGDYVHERILNSVGDLEQVLEKLTCVKGYKDRIFCKESNKSNLKYYCYLCDSVAEMSVDRYLNGIQSCMCGRVRLDYEDKVDKYLNTFTNIVEDIISIRGRMVYYVCKNCKKVSESQYDKIYLENPKISCKNCGFYSDYGEGALDNKTDNLYLVDFGRFAKIGRSFKPFSRFKTLCNVNKVNLNKAYLWRGLHKDVKMLERVVINKIQTLQGNIDLTSIKQGKTESFHNSSFYDIKSFIEENASEYNIYQ